MGKPQKGKHYLSINQRNELDKRFDDHQKGIGQSFTWDETLAMAKKLKPANEKLTKF
ncbi:hypothetical protein [Mucilaginibacter sp.]|uniref:hypothetical protein n=1 Tax=Mucilaginibacter sp. TaxID=1882438 RepID=UPI0025F4E581|nr:hypothetical protein [Mucilaginibacter sp.]